MSQAQVFVNRQTQSYSSLKAVTSLSKNQNAKFDVLNAHLNSGLVHAGELVIQGDPSTAACTSEEALAMIKASNVHRELQATGADADDFLLNNYDYIQRLLYHGALGAGVASDGWSRHLEAITHTLEEIEAAHRQFLGQGTLKSRDEFYARRTALFMKLDKQLKSIAALGSGLRKKGRVKAALGISTKRFLHSGEIHGYAEKIGDVSKAAKWAKRGGYLGVALDFASSGLEVHQACKSGREAVCTRTKFVQGGSFIGGTSGGVLGGVVGSAVGASACFVVLGVATGGPGALVCAVAGGLAGGVALGSGFGTGGEMMGEYLYEVFYDD